MPSADSLDTCLGQLLVEALCSRARWEKKIARGILAHIYLEVKFKVKNISVNNFFDPRPFWYVKMDLKYGWKYKGFANFIKGKISDTYFNFFRFIQFVCQNQMKGCDCWGPEGRLDTNIDQMDLCYIKCGAIDMSTLKYWSCHISSCELQILKILVSTPHN
jgi:hypothetical protein